MTDRPPSSDTGHAADVPYTDLVVVGEINVDLLMYDADAVPEPGREVVCRDMSLELGGSSAILSANAAALGLSIEFIGHVGRDLFGEFVVNRLRSRGVSVHYIAARADQATGATIAFTSKDGHGMLTFRGAMSSLTIEDVPWEVLSRARHLHVSSLYLLSGLRPGAETLFRRAKELGLTTSLDTNWDPDDEWGTDVLDVLSSVDIFLPNREEAVRIAGRKTLDEALDMLSERVPTVVATCGSDGVRARHDGPEIVLPALPLDVVDTVGAGDSFNAGFLTGYLSGDDIEASLHYGLLAAAHSATAPGGMAAFDDMAAFETLRRRHLGPRDSDHSVRDQ